MRIPRRHLWGTGAQPQHPLHAPLPGYLCEQCQDAPAVQWELAPEGGERGVCAACTSGGHREEDGGPYVWPN